MRKRIAVLSFLIWSMGIEAQLHTTFFNFNGVNQSLMVNPASPHGYRMVIGIPGLSGLGVHYNNTAFALGDIANDNKANANVETILSNLDGKERLNFYENLDVIFAGFGTKRGYFSFGVQQEATLLMNVPGDLLRFVYYGNVDGTNQVVFKDGDFNTEAIIQVNYHVGYQHYLLDSALIVGGRFKYISGTGHGHFKNFNSTLESDIFEWKIKTDILAETSGFDYIQNFGDYSPTDFIVSGNRGYAVDLGATWMTKKFQFSAALLNMGSVKWTQALKMYQSKGDFTWDGADVDESSQEIDFGDILDSLQEALQFNEIPSYSYTRQLPMHMMASAQYNLTKKHAFALTYQGDLWTGNLYNNIGINYIGNYAKRFNLILGYTRVAGGLNNVGLGISAALGPVQLFLMSDNVYGAVKPSDLSSTSVRFGLTLVFFDRKPKAAEPDVPAPTPTETPIPQQ